MDASYQLNHLYMYVTQRRLHHYQFFRSDPRFEGIRVSSHKQAEHGFHLQFPLLIAQADDLPEDEGQLTFRPFFSKQYQRLKSYFLRNAEMRAALFLILAVVATLGEKQWYYSGAALGVLYRERNIPGRIFYDFDRKTVKDPTEVMNSAGFNSFRVETWSNTCDGPSVFNNTNVLPRERNYQIFGKDNCMDTQELVAKGWKYVHTINMGEDIPQAWMNYTYKQMLGAIDQEVRRQLKPFLSAGLRPDIILFENEGESGFLFYEVKADGSRVIRSGDSCGAKPTGNFEASWPQLAGYHKQQIASVRAAVTEAGMDPSYTRFGLHNHVQYTQWKTPLIWGAKRLSEQIQSVGSNRCNFSAYIPSNILNANVTDDLDIIGYSAYVSKPDNSSMAALNASFADTYRRNDQLNKIIPAWGRWQSGPFAGQYKKQALGVEYATPFNPNTEATDAANQMNMLFKVTKAWEWYLGTLWWEPTYNFNNWNGGLAVLYSGIYNGTQTPAWPVSYLKDWGAASITYHDEVTKSNGASTSNTNSMVKTGTLGGASSSVTVCSTLMMAVLLMV
ncbi:hypothetical protein PROFUN_05219 [Planoprotostelium fungivorum]|uniref:Uncharacterized protein n=1 Tax=Planoprotostelium fungivorum TaxID=1890364 RepID=A0A2P6NRK4_9EUKA|nr:hypothetical protein PROFUN_05219 [Planoprotostelium fungivorum]